MRDELIELVVAHVDRQHHPVSGRLRERSHTLGDEVQIDVGLLERRVRRVEDERDLLRDLVVELLRQVHVRALGVVDDALQRPALLVVEVKVEMCRVIDVPVELVVDDLVLAERKCRDGDRGDGEQQGDDSLQGASRLPVIGCRLSVVGYRLSVRSRTDKPITDNR